jgi:ABC-type transport system substrate-binding protein
VLRIYPDSFNLTQALSSGEIDGVADTSQVETESLLRKLAIYQVKLPRSIYLFFNTERAAVSSVDRRRALRDGRAVDGEPELVVVTLANPKHEQLAEQIVQSWSKLGVRVIVETHTATELATEIVPKRAYDVLIYGLDFGGDPDPYPFWHSSQIGEAGLNLANFANIDADRLLEKARQTQPADERSKLYEQFGDDRRIQGIVSHAGVSVADRYAFVAQWYKKTKRIPKE